MYKWQFSRPLNTHWGSQESPRSTDSTLNWTSKAKRWQNDGDNLTFGSSRRFAPHASSSEGGWPGWWSPSPPGWWAPSRWPRQWSPSQGTSQGSSSQRALRSTPWSSWYWSQWQHLQKLYVHNFARSSTHYDLILKLVSEKRKIRWKYYSHNLVSLESEQDHSGLRGCSS